MPYWTQNSTRIELYGTDLLMIVGRHDLARLKPVQQDHMSTGQQCCLQCKTQPVNVEKGQRMTKGILVGYLPYINNIFRVIEKVAVAQQGAFGMSGCT